MVLHWLNVGSPLQCPECKSVNFPGTEQSLVVNRAGNMTSMSGTVMQEEVCSPTPLSGHYATHTTVKATCLPCLADKSP